MNTDADPFAGYEPNTTVEQKTLEAVSISLERLEEPRELGVCLEGNDQETASSQFPNATARIGSESTRNHVQS